MGIVERQKWRSMCKKQLVQFDAVDGDLIHASTTKGGVIVAILVNNVLKRINVQEYVYIERIFTDRHRNALEHFAEVVKHLCDIRLKVTITVHASDEGLADYVRPVDLRMYSYSLYYSAYRKSVFYSPIECDGFRDGDSMCCDGCDVIDGPMTTETDDTEIDFPLPEDVGQCVAERVAQAQITTTEIMHIYTQRVSFDAICLDMSLTRMVTGHDGNHFTLNRNCYVTISRIAMRDIETYRNSLKGDDANFVFEAIAGPNRQFIQGIVVKPELRLCVEIVPSYTMERIYEFSIAVASLDLPVYAILWIIDFLPGTQFVAHIKKLRYIEALKKSIHKVVDARVANKEQRLI